MSIDTGSYLLRDVTFRLTKPFKVDESLQSVEAYSTFREILPSVAVVADVELKQRNGSVDRQSANDEPAATSVHPFPRQAVRRVFRPRTSFTNPRPGRVRGVQQRVSQGAY